MWGGETGGKDIPRGCSGPKVWSQQHVQKQVGLSVLGEGGECGCLLRDGANTVQDLHLWFLSGADVSLLLPPRLYRQFA